MTTIVSYLEVVVYEGNGTTEIDQLEGAYSISAQRDLNTAGSGSFIIVMSDPKASPSTLLPGNLVRIRLNGLTFFSFWIEEPSEIVGSPSGPQGEELTISGRGGMAYMDRACVYPTSVPHPASTDIPYTLVPAASILLDQLNKAHARGAIPLMSWDFTATHDSAGVAWPDKISEMVHIGDDLLSLSQHLATVTPLEYIFDHDTFVLHCYNPPHGANRTETVVFRQGKHFANFPATESKHFSAVKSRMLVEGAALITSGVVAEVVDAAYEAETNIGRREGYMSYPQSTDVPTLSKLGIVALKDLEAQSLPLQISVTHGTDPGQYEPFLDYDIGDFVLVDIPGAHNMQEYRIVTITLGYVTVGAGDYSIQIDLNSPYIAPLLRVKQTIVSVLNVALMGGLGGSSGGSGVLGSAGCGGEILLAESYLAAPTAISADGNLITIPINVDTSNTRIRCTAKVQISMTSVAADTTLSFRLTGPDGTIRYLYLGGTPFGAWVFGEVEVPALTILPSGTANVLLDVVGCGGIQMSVYFQLLVYLVTSG